MLYIEQKTGDQVDASAILILTFEQRSRSRLRATLNNGMDAAISLERGQQLLPGDRLLAKTGEVIAVHAANETLSVATTSDSMLLARACYHLGNRHVVLQIGVGEVRYMHDHVLDDMLISLGMHVQTLDLPFTPESGAYGEHAHIGGHSH